MQPMMATSKPAIEVTTGFGVGSSRVGPENPNQLRQPVSQPKAVATR